MTELRAEGLTYALNATVLVEAASLVLKPGEFVALLGPNGAGKTCLLRALVGLVSPAAGTATLDGQRTDRLAPPARARLISYLPQARTLAWPVGVRDVVALGRFAYGAPPGRLSAADAAAVSRALDACGLDALSHRRTDTLSGGEIARVHVARALAAEAPLLIADEPVAALDPKHQVQVMALLKAYVGRGGGALVVLHDLALAAQFADRLIFMKGGRLLADGAPRAVLTSERIGDIYGVHADIAWAEGAPPAIAISALR